MNKTFCWIFATMLSTGLVAQPATNAVAAATVEAPAPAAPKTKVAAQKPDLASLVRSDPLAPGPAVVVASNVNVRGQAKLKSEVVTRVTKDQQVTVLEEIILKRSAPDEPSAWAKILLPAGIRVWVNTAYVNAATKAVIPKKLNLRAGPGENYSILGTIVRGDTVSEVITKGDWMQIEAPTNAYAFMAAQYLRQEPTTPALVATTTPTEPTPTEPTPAEPAPVPASVPEAPVVVAAPDTVPAVPATDPAVTPAEPATTDPMEVADIKPAPVEIEPAPPSEEPPPPRIIQREGWVRSTTSIQAPSPFALISPETGRTINYLYTTSPNLDLMRYKGLRIVVTGEESLDRRWKNTPVITIQRIQVIE